MRLVLFAIAITLAACGKGDPQKCDAACRNYAELLFWEKADKEIASVPADQQEALRKKKLIELASNIERGMDFCVSKCMAANNDEQTKCLSAAKSATDVKACTADE